MRCLLVLVLLVAAVAVVAWLVLRPAPPPEPLRATPLAGVNGYADQPSISPDGQRVAFISKRDQADNADVYVKPVGRGAAVRLTRQAAAEYSPAWSPDGGRIAFLRAAPGASGRSEVVVMPAAGGLERKVGEIRLEPDSFLLPGPFLCWAPDASALVVTDREAEEDSASLYLLSVATGRKSRITSPPLGAPGDSGPSFSPDGRTLAFVRSTGFAVADLYVVPLTPEYLPAGDAARRTYENRFSAGTAWTPDGREILFSGYAGGERALYRVKSAGPEAPERLQTLGSGYWPSVSARARRLIFARRPGDGDAFLRSRTPAPGGRHLAFFANLEGQNEVYVIPAEGGRPRRITDDPGDDILPAWSRDGDWIYFWSNRGERYQVWKVRAFGADLTAVEVTRPEERAEAGRLAPPPRAGPPSSELMVVEKFH